MFLLISANSAYADNSPTDLPFKPTINLGCYYSPGGINRPIERENVMLVGNIDFLKRSPKPSTWGAGLRLSADEDGHRWGVRFLYRNKLGNSGKGYWQVGPGFTFLGGDYERNVALPTGFCELELGHESWGALSLAVELMSYRDLFVGYDDDLNNMTRTAIYEDKSTELSWYMGAKVAGWKGVALFLAMFGAGYYAHQNSTF